jgi:hypothetical protein
MLIYKAQRADGKGEVEGWYTYWEDLDKMVEYHLIESGTADYLIKPETLKVKVGEQWFTIDELEEMQG